MLPDSLLYHFDTRCVWKVCIKLCPDNFFFRLHGLSSAFIFWICIKCQGHVSFIVDRVSGGKWRETCFIIFFLFNSLCVKLNTVGRGYNFLSIAITLCRMSMKFSNQEALIYALSKGWEVYLICPSQ